MGVESATEVHEKPAAAHAGSELFTCLELRPTRGPRNPSLVCSAILQVVLWLGLAWLLNSPPRADWRAPFMPADVTWVIQPQPAPPPVPATPPRASRRPRPRLARIRRASPRARPAPLPLPPRPVIPHHLSLDPPSVRNAAPVAAEVVAPPTKPLPPQSRSVASVKVGSFAAADPPAVPRSVAAAPRSGLFAATAGDSVAAPAAPATLTGAFATAPERSRPRAPQLSAAALPAPHFGFEAPTQAGAPAHPPRPRSADYQPPLILSKPVPRYTPLARAEHLQGDVVLRVVLSATGAIRVLNVVQGLGAGLDQAAQAAVRAIRFQPARRGARPVDATVLVRVSFRLAE